MANGIRHRIGQIFLDGGFISTKELDMAFEEQKLVKELLGQVLVRMGVLKEWEIDAPLKVQEHLSTVGDAVRIAAGERQLLGALLVQSGRITGEQLDRAIAEQKWTGERLGDVFTRLGMLTEPQLAALLEFQHNQSNTSTYSPLRLGELLIATGYISRDQLEDALHKQSFSHKKIGEVLVEEGYVRPSQLKSGFRLQKMLVKSVLAAILSLSLSAPVLASSVSLQWDANSEPDLAGYRVYHNTGSTIQQGTTPLNVVNQTTATIDNLDPNFSYTFAVTAYNSSGLESSFSNTVTVAELAPPTVDITSPSDAVTVSGVVSMNVTASDNVGVSKVEFLVNDQLKASDTSGPYSYLWDTTAVTPGAYTLTAKAYDTSGNISQTSRTVTVVSDAIPPTVAMTAPANNAVLSGTATISAGASDNVGVTRVEFYGNGVLLYASNVSPYNFSWDTTTVSNGTHTINAWAFDNAGNSTQSSSVTVTVNNVVADAVAPTVSSFSLPATATSLTVPVSSFAATDAVGVTGYLITESASAPSAGAAGWSAGVPASYTFASAGAKTAYAWAKDAAGNVSASRSASVTITLPDVTAPAIGTFTLPVAATSLTVSVSGLTATDAVGVTGYLISEGATAPSASASGWSASAPTSFTFASAGAKTAYAWAKDAAGNVSASRSASVTITLPDIVAPAVNSFSIPATATALTVPVYGLSASDAVGVTGYLITESATAPSASAAGWSATAPTSFTFASAGAKTAYAWAKDAAGNVSAGRSASVTITLPVADVVAPVVTSFSLPATATSLSVPVSGLSATDAVGVSGYLITESATAPSATSAGWSAGAPTSFTFASAGAKTAYAWAKDAAGNVSAGLSAAVTITIPDATAPAVNSFSLPATATSLTVPVSGLTASDTVGVTGYLITESATAPSATSAGWSAGAPTSFTFASAGAKTAYAWAKDAAGNVSAGLSAAVTITIPDATAPAVNSFSLPATATSLTVPVSGLTASDTVGVTGYLITESATAPSASAAGWSATAPTSFTFASAGAKTAYAWAKDAAGNVSASRSASVTITLPVADAVAPTVTGFSLPATATALTVPVSGLAASDAVGITGYLITESATAPSAGTAGWSATVPTSFTFASAGAKTAYAWAKDAAGNVSASRSASVSITLPDVVAPAVTGFSIPGTATALTVPVSGLSASDAVGVTGYLITESATAPSASAAGWSATAPTSFTFASAGAKTAYAWAKDAAGNVSASRSASVSITLPDVVAPAVTGFSIPGTATALTVPVSGLSASDAVGVTGYLITESATAPSASAAGWSATAPTSFTFASAGAKTAYAWAKDAAGNVSASRSASVTITLPVADAVAPTVTGFSLPATATALTVPVSGLAASDAVGITGYLITESATAPSASAAGWSATVPTSFTFASAGAKTAYAWAKDAAGNVSASRSASVTITLPVADAVAPTVTGFSLPATATALTVPVSGLAASDAVGITGYLITESATAPSAGTAGWSATAPTSFTFASAGAKTAYAWAKDAAGNVSASRSASVTITLPVADAVAPTVTGFSLPATATALTVPVSGLAASDAVGITGYLITESATAPSASAAGWSATAPASYTFASAGVKTAYAWAKDAAGNVSASRSASVTITLPDVTAPAVAGFSIPGTATSLTVPVSGLTASDAVGVTGYLITESATAPSAGAAGWSATAPASYTFASAGAKTAYAWAKDAAGNVSASRSASVSITLPDVVAPAVTGFSLPATATSLTVPVSGLSATDAVGVTGYLITESATAPSASAAGWSASAPASSTFSSAGVKTAYAWAKDAAGNVSAGRSASVTITLPDTIAPAVTGFTLPVTATSLTVPVSGLSATDAVGVSGYLITESATAPSAGAAGWSSSAPTSFTFASAGEKTAYAWAKDAAGNVSASRSATVTITTPDVTAPAVGSFILPATATSLTVSVSGLSASDAVGVTGYLITESAIAPSASTAGWSATAPTSFTFSSAGVKTAYAWAKDVAGNVSASRSASVTITLPEATIADALLALQIGSGRVTATPEQMVRLDVSPIINGVSVPDGKINTGDAIALLSKSVGKK